MKFNSATAGVSLLPVPFLIIATMRMPYGYYTFTRIVVCCAAIAIIALILKAPASRAQWSVGIFGIIVVLFNPVLPIHLSRHAWFTIDLTVAAIFAGHFLLCLLKEDRSWQFINRRN